MRTSVRKPTSRRRRRRLVDCEITRHAVDAYLARHPEARPLGAIEHLVLAVAGVLASAAAERPGERVHVQPALEARRILAGSVDVHLAVEKLRRRYGWQVAASEGKPGYQLTAWPFRFGRNRCRHHPGTPARFEASGVRTRL